MTQESLRQNVGVVQQEVFLFAASIWRTSATESPVPLTKRWPGRQKLAEIYDDIVAMPGGFNT